MTWFKRVTVIFTLLAIISNAPLFAATEVLTFDNEELRERYTELTFLLRCPKCDNQNVADSNAPISEDIRQKTYEMLHQDYSDQEIIDFMISRYTEFVTYKPQFSMVTMWLWLVPAFVLIIGLSFLISLTRKKSTENKTTLSEEEQQRLNALLEDK